MKNSVKVLTILISSLVLSIILYITLLNVNSKNLVIWEEGSISSSYMSIDIENRLNDIKNDNDIRKVQILIRPSDNIYYEIAFSLNAIYSSDVFILSNESFSKNLENDIYMDISNIVLDYSLEDVVSNEEGKVIGLILDENHILAINNKSKYDYEFLDKVIDIIVKDNK